MYEQIEIIQQECEERNAKFDDLTGVCQDQEEELAAKADELHKLAQEHDKAIVDADIISDCFERIATKVFQTITQYKQKTVGFLIFGFYKFVLQDETFDASSVTAPAADADRDILTRLVEAKRSCETEVRSLLMSL